MALRNYPEWSICAWAVLAIGAVLVPLNAWETGETLRRMIADAGAKVVFADKERLERLGCSVPDATIVGVRSGGGPGTLEALIGASADYARLAPEELADALLIPDDDATLFFTSGTTGVAKGALGTHRNLATNLVNTGYRAARAAVRRGGSPAAGGAERRVLLPLPFFHVTGFQSTLVPALANGTTVHLMYKWDGARALELVARERLHALTLVPTQALQLVDLLEQGAHDVSSVDTVGYGGAAAPATLAPRVRKRFPSAWPGQGYGATETSSLTAANFAEDMLARPDSVGVACPACDVRFVGEDGTEVAPGTPGELWVRGPNVVQGYWNRPEATAEAFHDGWYRTGDIGQQDSDDLIVLLDRAKDMLIRGGENIYCAEIEEVLLDLAAVEEVAVLGAPHPVLGEVVAAVLCARPGHALSAEEVAAHAAARLPAHKRPAVLRLRKAPLPRNAAGKVLKRELKAELAAGDEPEWAG